MKKMLLLFFFSFVVNAEPLCLVKNNTMLSVDMRPATSFPVNTVSLVGSIYSRNGLTIQPVIGAGAQRNNFWIFSIPGVPVMRLDANFNPLIPEGWNRVNCF